MSDELNMEAERAAFEAWAWGAATWIFGDDEAKTFEDGHYIEPNVDSAWRAWQASSRTAPVSAPMGPELPPLPEDRFSLWLQHGKVVNCFTHGVGDPAVWDHDKHWEKKGYSRAPLYTVEQFREGQQHAYQRGRMTAVRDYQDVVDKSAERIRQLERDLAERKTASIDTPEFWRIVWEWRNAYDEGPAERNKRAHEALIDHIDGRTAGTSPKGWKLMPVEPTDDMIVAFAEQWYSKARCIDDCEMEDCYAAMIAAAPTPTDSGKEEA
jgi:hypothetical protein